MRYKDVIIRINGNDVVQVNKTTAKKFFDKGKLIYLHPSKMVLENPWMKPTDHKNDRGYNFEQMIHSWCYYNGNSELGLYPHYFVFKSDF